MSSPHGWFGGGKAQPDVYRGWQLVSVSPAARAIRDTTDALALAVRLANDLPAFLRRPITGAEAQQRVRQRLAQRERRFLVLVDHAIYCRPHSPYHWLLQQAGVEQGDLGQLVRQEGVEGALSILASRGVYVQYDEVKGRVPIVRGSARRTFPDRAFDNPLTRPHLMSFTGGSGGRPARVVRSLANVAEGATVFGTVLEAYGIRHPQNVFWLGGAVTWQLIHLKLRQRVDAWYSQSRPTPPIVWAGHRYMAALVALGGRRLPLPAYCDAQQPEPIVRWLVKHVRADAPIVVNATVSASVRIALTARRLGHSLAGVTFHCRSEATSPARRRLMEASGATVLPDYASVELAYMAFGCPRPAAADDLHLSTDRYAAISRQRPLSENGPLVSAALFTTLTPHAPKLALNMELGDSARIEQRDCDCLLGTMGLRTHLSDIQSFEKLTSEGITFGRGNMLHILETVLPARFGGTALDYQLQEQEAADGAARLVLRVGPSLGELDEDAVRATLLQEMARGGMIDAYQSRLIGRADTVSIRRVPPIVTRAGKVLPLHLARSGGAGR